MRKILWFSYTKAISNIWNTHIPKYICAAEIYPLCPKYSDLLNSRLNSLASGSVLVLVIFLVLVVVLLGYSFLIWQTESQLALFDISISNIDCRYIDTFEKYRYQYRYGHFENIDIDIDKTILENIDINIGMVILKISISISIRQFWKISVSKSISIRQFWKYRYRYR